MGGQVLGDPGDGHVAGEYLKGDARDAKRRLINGTGEVGGLVKYLAVLVKSIGLGVAGAGSENRTA